MGEEMKFPDTLDEFMKQYSFIDEEQIYTNGSELIQTFRIKQWEEHNKQENQKYKEVIDKALNDIDLVIELIKQQPSEDDSWILGRLNAFKIILKEVE